MGNKLVVIGLGNMGRRHLQAAAQLPEFERLIGHDRESGSFVLAQAALDGSGVPSAGFCFEQELDACLSHIDGATVVVIATTAKGRARLVEEVLIRRPLAVVAEKPLCQTIKELSVVKEAAHRLGVPVYVNLSRRVFGCYQQIFSETEGVGPRHILASWPKGIACNGIHLLDFAGWIARTSTFKILDSQLDAPFDLGRPGFKDFTGQFSVRLGNRDSAVFSCSKDSAVFSVNVLAGSLAFHVYESQGKMIVAHKDRPMATVDISVPFCSQFMTGVFKDILGQKKPVLPDVVEASFAHELLFALMEQHGLADLNIT